jgi:hypothetical protein
VVSFLSQINPVHTTPFYLSNFHLNIIHLLISWYSWWTLMFRLSHQCLTCIPLLSLSCSMSCPSQLPWPDHSNYDLAKRTSYEAYEHHTLWFYRPWNLKMSRYSDWLRGERPRVWVRVPVGSKNVLFSTASRPVLGPTQPPIQLVTGAPSLWVKRQGRETDHPPPTSAEVKKMWSIHPLPHTSSWTRA